MKGYTWLVLLAVAAVAVWWWQKSRGIPATTPARSLAVPTQAPFPEPTDAQLEAKGAAGFAI